MRKAVPCSERSLNVSPAKHSECMAAIEYNRELVRTSNGCRKMCRKLPVMPQNE